MSIAWSTQELVAQYKQLSSGHFFDADTMRFFKSRITGNYRRLSDTEALFITTEKGPDNVRKATIRRATLVKYIRESDGRECEKIIIDTMGDFYKLNLAQAKRLMKKL